MTHTLIVDANILIRAVLGRRVYTLMESFHQSTRFVTPSSCQEEARRYLPALLAKRGRAADEGAVARDPNDWPLLAAAWALDAAIWSEDQDFFGLGIPVWNTASVEVYLSGQLSEWLHISEESDVPDN